MAVVLAFAGRVQPCNERQLPAVRDDAQCGACTGESRTGPQDVEKPLPIEPLRQRSSSVVPVYADPRR